MFAHCSPCASTSSLLYLLSNNNQVKCIILFMCTLFSVSFDDTDDLIMEGVMEGALDDLLDAVENR